jgi:hypothetical protein
MFTLLDASFSLDEDGGTILLINLAADIETTEEALAVIESIGKEFTLTPK